MTIETILSPAELPALPRRDLRTSACVVFDVLRATSTFVTALQNGAREILPVGEIPEAVARRRAQPSVLLAGERNGFRIRAAQSGGIDFDFGNSPREFTAEKIRDATIVSTTTNGTRALRACAGAQWVLAAAFLNLTATANFLQGEKYSGLLLVCAGTGEGVALEDVLAAGALAEFLLNHSQTHITLSDSTQVALKIYVQSKTDLPAAIQSSQNGRRLLEIPGLRDDVAYCTQCDIFNLVAAMNIEGAIRKV